MDDELLRKIERLEAQVEALTSELIPKVDRGSKRRDKRQVFAGFGLFAIAILIAGTMSASALSGSDTVLSDDIKDTEVHGSDINTNAVSSSKVKDNSLTGADVNESSLVPTCPTGLSRAGDVCYSPLKTMALFGDALTACAGERLRLPSLSEMYLVGAATGDTAFLWVDDAGYYESATVHKLVAARGGSYIFTVSSSQEAYRCVTTVGGRP